MCVIALFRFPVCWSIWLIITNIDTFGDPTTGFYWSYTLLLKSPVLMHSWITHTSIRSLYIQHKPFYGLHFVSDLTDSPISVATSEGWVVLHPPFTQFSSLDQGSVDLVNFLWVRLGRALISILTSDFCQQLVIEGNVWMNRSTTFCFNIKRSSLAA